MPAELVAPLLLAKGAAAQGGASFLGGAAPAGLGGLLAATPAGSA